MVVAEARRGEQSNLAAVAEVHERAEQAVRQARRHDAKVVQAQAQQVAHQLCRDVGDEQVMRQLRIDAEVAAANARVLGGAAGSTGGCTDDWAAP